MASPAQTVANLANSQLSTGPRTEAGKHRASLNAMKHGLNSALVVIAAESQEEFDDFRNKLLLQWSPANPTETALVEQFAAVNWRSRRISRLEAEILGVEEPDFQRLNILSLHASRLSRESSTVLKDLRQLQQERHKREEKQMEAAILLRKADLAAGRPTDLTPIGFVLNMAEIDLRLRREQALEEARNVLKMPRTRKAA